MDLLMLSVGFSLGIIIAILGMYNKNIGLLTIASTIIILIGFSTITTGVQTQTGSMSNIEAWINNTTNTTHEVINETYTYKDYEGISAETLGILIIFTGVLLAFIGLLAAWFEAGFLK